MQYFPGVSSTLAEIVEEEEEAGNPDTSSQDAPSTTVEDKGEKWAYPDSKGPCVCDICGKVRLED